MGSFDSEKAKQVEELTKKVKEFHEKHGDLSINAMTRYTNRIKELRRRQNKIAELNQEIETLKSK